MLLYAVTRFDHYRERWLNFSKILKANGFPITAILFSPRMLWQSIIDQLASSACSLVEPKGPMKMPIKVLERYQYRTAESVERYDTKDVQKKLKSELNRRHQEKYDLK